MVQIRPEGAGAHIKQHALKGQKLLAQGNALGVVAISKAPCKGNSFVYCPVFWSFCPYRATGLCPQLPRALPWAKSFCLLPMFRPVTVGSGRTASMSFYPLPLLSAGDLWFRACCFYELLPFTFALPFGQLFSIPLRAGDRWLRVCWVISTV